MKKEKLLKSIGGISDKYIKEANPLDENGQNIKSSKMGPIVAIGAVAACLCLIALAITRFGQNTIIPADADEEENTVLSQIKPESDTRTNSSSTPEEELPKIKAYAPSGRIDYKIYNTDNINELETLNPWSESHVYNTMPVFKNLTYLEDSGEAVFIDGMEEMENRAQEVAIKLGEEIITTKSVSLADLGKDLQEKVENPEKAILTVEAETNSYTISVTGDMSVSIMPKQPMPVPEEIGMSSQDGVVEELDKGASEQYQKGLDYFLDKYGELFHSVTPKAKVPDSVFIQDYPFYWVAYKGDRITHKQEILDYFFSDISFYTGADGLSMIHVNDKLALMEKIGDYPILTPDEAKQALIDGTYNLSQIPDDSGSGDITSEIIEKVELTYEMSNLWDTVAPYYTLYVKGEHEGKDVYFGYQLPAVRPEYLLLDTKVIYIESSGKSSGIDIAEIERSNAEALFELTFTAPNIELTNAISKSATHIGEGVESVIVMEDFFSPFFEEYVSEDYIDSYIINYGMLGQMVEKSTLETFNLVPGDDSDAFTLVIGCKKEGMDAEMIEITGTMRFDNEGKVENVKINTGLADYMRTQ